MAAPPSSLAFGRQSFLSLCATLAPASYLPLAAFHLPHWHYAGSRQERGGLSESTIRSWRRLLPSLDFIAVSPGLFLQLAGQSDLWLPLLISVGSFPMSPHQILLLLRSFNWLLCHHCCCLQSRRVWPQTENSGGDECWRVVEWPRTYHVLLLWEHEGWIRCSPAAAGMGHHQLTKRQESILGTIQAGRCCADEGRHEVTPAFQEPQGKITFLC